ncbi:MAG: hypothetical protein LUF35_05440 [Lachnospiraceae bacterium]|nr:hypothetical protein [Lachnospiraceae bacterium]
MEKLKRVAAMAGVILLAGMYVVTLILGLTASPATQNMLMASIVCTVVVPVLLYAMMLVARVLGSSDKEDPASKKQAEEGRKSHTGKN